MVPTEPLTLIGQYLGHLAESPGVLAEICRVVERSVAGRDPGTHPGHPRPLKYLGHLRQLFQTGLERRFITTEIDRQSGGSPHQLLRLHVGQQLAEFIGGELRQEASRRRDRLEAVLVCQPDRLALIGPDADHPARQVHGKLPLPLGGGGGTIQCTKPGTGQARGGCRFQKPAAIEVAHNLHSDG